MPPTAIGHFKQSAEKLIEEKGAMEALAAALAHISGAMSVDQHSLITSEASFVTMILRCSTEMPSISYAWKELKEQLGEDTDSKVKGMVFLKGKQGVCFDIPTASVTEVQEKWHDSRHWQLSVATTRARRSTGRISQLPRTAGRQSRLQGTVRGQPRCQGTSRK